MMRACSLFCCDDLVTAGDTNLHDEDRVDPFTAGIFQQKTNPIFFYLVQPRIRQPLAE
jgi:hypothetical protein